MPLESGTHIGDLVVTNPPGTDLLSESDDHHRLIKRCITGSFPNAANDVLNSTFPEIDAAVGAVIKNNWVAVTDPTVDDDSGAGYSVGSRWLNTLTNSIYTAVDVTVGAAVWILVSSSVGPDFESPEQTIGNSVSSTVAHGLGVIPSEVQLYLLCKTNNGGWLVDELMRWDGSNSSGVIVVGYDATNLYYSIGQSISTNLDIPQKTGGSVFSADVTHWRGIVRAWA